MGRLLFLTLMFHTSYVKAESNYYVDSYDKGKYELYVITINGCETSFKVSKDKHSDLAKDDKALDEMVTIANKRSKTGCK